MRHREHSYYVYILSNKKGVLYVGVTNDLERRLTERKARQTQSFTSHYHIDRLLCFEFFTNIGEAIAAEKRIKGWKRKRKLDLIRTINPTFRDLSEDWR